MYTCTITPLCPLNGLDLHGDMIRGLDLHGDMIRPLPLGDVLGSLLADAFEFLFP